MQCRTREVLYLHVVKMMQGLVKNLLQTPVVQHRSLLNHLEQTVQLRFEQNIKRQIESAKSRAPLLVLSAKKLMERLRINVALYQLAVKMKKDLVKNLKREIWVQSLYRNRAHLVA